MWEILLGAVIFFFGQLFGMGLAIAIKNAQTGGE